MRTGQTRLGMTNCSNNRQCCTIASFVRLSAAGHGGFDLWGFPVCAGMLAAYAIYQSWNSISIATHRLKPTAEAVKQMKRWQPGLQWQDFYASSDPVPNGTLSASDSAGLRRVVSRKVRVLGSVLQDHTAYWTSRGDFVTRVVQALDKCSGTGLFTASGVSRVREARFNFIWCVRILVVLRWMSLLALALPILAILLPLQQFERLSKAGTGLFNWLMDRKISSVEKLVGSLQTGMAWVADSLATQPGDTGKSAAGIIMLAVLALATWYVWGRIVAYWWEHLASLAMSPAFNPRGRKVALIMQVLLFVWVLALGLLPLALSATWTFFPGAITLSNLDLFLANFARATFIVLYAVIMFLGAFAAWELAVQLVPVWRRHGNVKDALKAIPDWWVVPFFLLIYGVGGGWLLLAIL